MCTFHGAQGVLRTSKSAPGRFVPPAGAGACPVLDTGTESIAVVDVRPPWRTGHPADVQICSRQICMVEGQIVRTDNLHGDSRPQGCAQSLPPCFRRGRLCGCKQGDGRNERIKRSL